MVEPALGVGDAVGEPVERLLWLWGVGEGAVSPELSLVVVYGVLVGSPGLGGGRRRGLGGVASRCTVGVDVFGDMPAVPVERVA